jgi:hypothetical protein
MYMKGKLHKCGIKISHLCKTYNSYMQKREPYTGTHSFDKKHNNAFSISDKTVGKQRTRVILSMWIGDFLAQNSLTTCGYVIQKLQVW